MPSLTQTLQKSIIPGFITDENINLIICTCTNILATEYKQPVYFTRDGVIREMNMIYNEYPELIVDMNRRVVMSLCQQFRNQIAETERQNYFMDNFRNAYNYDPSLGIKPFETPKLNSRYRGLRFNTF